MRYLLYSLLANESDQQHIEASRVSAINI